MTDEECIALALLHGATIWPSGNDRTVYDATFFAIDAGFGPDVSCLYADGRVAYNKAGSPGEAARRYCERHGLFDEVTP